MEGILASLESMPLVETVRFSRWGYATVNTAHILGLALVVGAIVPLNLRLLGIAWRHIERDGVVRILSTTAASGLALAIGAGVVLFATRATEYAATPIFWVKIALVAFGTAAAVLAHARYGRTLERATRRACASHAAISLVCWIGALTCGRMIAFVLP